MRPLDDTLEGYAWLPRLIDKSRASRAGTLGGLTHPCPVDRRCLGLLGIDAEAFGDLVAEAGEDDGAVMAALRRRGIPSAREAWFDAVAFERELQAGVR